MTKEAQRAHRIAMADTVSRFKRSGKSQSQFCKDDGIKPHVLSYWVAKASRAEEAGTTQPKAAYPFIEIAQQETTCAGVSNARRIPGHIELTLPEGTVIRATGEINEALLTAVIAAAKGPS